jgi:hypothetical protein
MGFNGLNVMAVDDRWPKTETYGSQEFLHMFTIPGWGWKGYSMIFLFWDEQSILMNINLGLSIFSYQSFWD